MEVETPGGTAPAAQPSVVPNTAGAAATIDSADALSAAQASQAQPQFASLAVHPSQASYWAAQARAHGSQC